MNLIKKQVVANTPERFFKVLHLQPKRTALWPKTQWSLQRLAEASLRDVGDGLHMPMVSPHRRRSIDEVAGSAQPNGFGRPLFSPRSARGDRAAAGSSLDSAGGWASASKLRADLAVLICGTTALLLESRACQAR